MKYADGTYEDADWMMLELKKKKIVNSFQA